MRVTVVNGRDMEAQFQARTFGVPSQETFDYLNQISADFQMSVTPEARSHFQEVEKFYRTITFDDAIAALRNLELGVNSLNQPNRFVQLTNIADFQHAPDIMIPIVMANPTIRKLFENSEVEGYGDRLNDIYGDLLGDTTPIYQAVVNGIRRETIDGEYVMEIFPEAAKGSDLYLDMEDQIISINTWSNLEALLQTQSYDPTSQYNSKL